MSMLEVVEQGTGLRADAARNRERVLATARKAVAGGDLSLQLNDIARRAGVGVGTVYRHFPTPRALLESVAAEPLRGLLDVAAEAEANQDPWQGIERLARAFARLTFTDAAAAEVLAAGADELEWTSTVKHDLDRIAGVLLTRGRAAGVVRAGIDADDMRLLICGVAHAARGGDGDPLGRAERYLTVMLAGMRP